MIRYFYRFQKKKKMDKQKKKRTSFRALTFAQIMTQRLQKSESGKVVCANAERTNKKVQKEDKLEDRRKSGNFQEKLAKFKQVEKTGEMIDTNITYQDEKIFRQKSFKDRVESFFRYYNPEKLKDEKFLNSVLEIYSDGKQEILLAHLNRIYGPEPNPKLIVEMSELQKERSGESVENRVRALLAREAFRDRVENIYTKHNPSKLNDAAFLDTLMEVYRGNEILLMQQLIAKYGE